MIPEIHIEDYNYPLPDERIAKYPLPERDSSKLLHYVGGRVDEFVFRQLPELLPDNSLMITRLDMFTQSDSGDLVSLGDIGVTS